MYEYNAQLVRVVDGDTLALKVDCGFRISWTDNFRVAHVDTPELTTTEGHVVKDKLIEFFDGFKNAAGEVKLRIRTLKADKYGRWLFETTDIYSPSDNTWFEFDLDDWLVGNGYATLYEGGAR